MVKDLFRRYVWLVDVVYRAGRLTFEEINERWRRTEMSGGEDLPLKTFHNHRHAIADIFGIDWCQGLASQYLRRKQSYK